MGITARLAKDLEEIRVLSERDIEQLHLLILDYFAAARAGYWVNRPFNDRAERVLLSRGGAEESFVMGQGKRYPAATAAFLNALYGHGAELDDGNRKAAGHGGVHLIPAVFALADRIGSTGEEVLLALAVGYEAYIRIFSAAQPGLVKRGFHSTGMAGAIASAAACAKLYPLDAAGIENAMALATTMSSGLLSYGDSRPVMKPLNPARAAESGLLAAQLAKEGMEGPEEALEGPHGWFHAVTDEIREEYLAGTDHLLLHDCYLKLYPSCRHTHCGLDAAITLSGRVRTEDIEEVRAFLYPNAIELAGIRDPKDRDETKFSVPYTIACGLVRGAYGIDDMDPAAASPRIRDLMEKITLIPDPSLEDREKGIRGARVTVLRKDGTSEEETVLVPRGDPERPLTREEVLEKLAACAGDPAAAKALAAKTENIRGGMPFENPMGE